MNEIVEQNRELAATPGFSNGASWELAQRVAKAFSASDLVPKHYQGNVANCIIALEMANRLGASPLMVMQSLFMVHGTPSWSSKFLIASFNQCGRFSAMRYRWSEDRKACRAWAIEKATGEELVGPEVTMQMAQAEGWSTKTGSKWKTMPELMLMYRAAAFMVRLYAPEISMGLQTAEELGDVGPEPKQASGLAAVRAAIKSTEVPALPSTPPAESRYQELADAIRNSTNVETAGLILDEGHECLDQKEFDDLQEVFAAREAELTKEQ